MAEKENKKVRSKKSRRKKNLLKLCSVMNRVCMDAVDREVIKRFRTFIDTCDEDITKVSLQSILKKPKDVDISLFVEGLQPYIKHYIYMMKREKE